MEPFFFTRALDGTHTRFQRFDDQPIIAPLLMPVTGLVQELVRLQTGRTVTLMQSGLVAGTKRRPDIISTDEKIARVSNVVSIGSEFQQFQVTAVAAGSVWLWGNQMRFRRLHRYACASETSRIMVTSPSI